MPDLGTLGWAWLQAQNQKDVAKIQAKAQAAIAGAQASAATAAANQAASNAAQVAAAKSAPMDKGASSVPWAWIGGGLAALVALGLFLRSR
jgi:hypothetical protein